MKNGWVRLHRQIADNELWLLEPFTKGQAWVDLFLNANHKEGVMNIRGNIIPIKRGQIGWSELTMAKRWTWSKNKVRRFLKLLETKQQIIQQKERYITTIITISNYDRYQDDTADDTAERQQKDSRRYINNNDKNDNNDKNMSKDIQAKPVYGNQDINNLIKEFETVRGFKSTGGAKDRIMAKHLLTNYTPEQLTYMLKFCDKPFAPRVGSVCDLWFQRGKILAGIKDLKNSKNNITIIG